MANTHSTSKPQTTKPIPPEEPEEKESKSFGQILVYIIYVFAWIAVTLLTFRFFLLLFGASAGSGFVEFIYRSSEIVMSPFRGIFEYQELDNGKSILDLSALFAIVVYLMLAFWMSSFIKRWEREEKQRQYQDDLEKYEAAVWQSKQPPVKK